MSDPHECQQGERASHVAREEPTNVIVPEIVGGPVSIPVDVTARAAGVGFDVLYTDPTRHDGTNWSDDPDNDKL